MRAFNAAANWLAGEAVARRTANKIELQRLYYAQLRERFGLSAQMAVRCIAQTCEAYKRDKTKRPHFRALASIPYDQRMMSFKGVDKVSLLTLEGRVIVPIVMGAYQAQRFSASKGQSDLVFRNDGKWFLLVSVNLPEGTTLPVGDFLGVDLGVANLATDSDGEFHSGAPVESCRTRNHNLRKLLQHAAKKKSQSGSRPKNIRRKLKSLAGREARFRLDVNHKISKRLVAKAKDTGRGIALEDLAGIRERTRFHRQQRAKMAGWGFDQLRTLITYKARREGVSLAVVHPRNTSRMCSVCRHVDKDNRTSQEKFHCMACGSTDHADVNAARNIRAKAPVIAPNVSEQLNAFGRMAKYRDKPATFCSQ